MGYVGNQQTEGYSQVPAKQDLTGATGTSLTLTHAVASAEGIDLFINNVRQEPTTAYSVGADGVTVTLTGSVVATDDIYVVYNSLARQTSTHPSNQALQATSGTFSGDLTVDTNTLYVDSTNNSVGIGTATPSTSHKLTLDHTINYGGISLKQSGTQIGQIIQEGVTGNVYIDADSAGSGGSLILRTNGGSERMRIDSSGRLLVGTTDTSLYNNTSGDGFIYDAASGSTQMLRDGGTVLYVNRASSDGGLVEFFQDGSKEGTISVSGGTVTYGGGHLGRWSRLTDNSKDTSIVKGTVMTNLDEMVEWSHETTYWTDEDELPDGVSVGDVKTAAYVEDNEQLNKMAVSSVEGDANVAGVFVNWDNDDDEFNDMIVAMTGDMVIRIAQGTTVARGDLLMSAGDGTAKPQGDDIVRSKTIAKVTSTNVSHTYDDGSYLVPCVLMAC